MSVHLVTIHQQMSSCLSGGAGRAAAAAYGLDLEMMMMVKSPSSTSSSTVTSHSPTLSESGGNSPFTISTRKPRTPRKRPNQTYNEAAALLSTAYPGIFSSAKPSKFTKPPQLPPIDAFFSGGSELLFPLRVDVDPNPEFLLHHHHHLHPTPVSEKPRFLQLPVEPMRLIASCDKMLDEDFETESMLGGEIEEGIDSIMGINYSCDNNKNDNAASAAGNNNNLLNNVSGWCYGYPMGWGIETETSSSSLEWRNGVRALRHAADDDGDWWRYPRVDVTDISPKFSKIIPPEKKKKKKPLEKINKLPPAAAAAVIMEGEKPTNNHVLFLKLNHDNLLAEWSDRGGSSFSDEPPGGNEAVGRNLHDRLAQIDLFPDNGGVREASVLRYKEKRRSRLFFKKIRYQVRKVNADQRPRLKGRFVRRPGSPDEET